MSFTESSVATNAGAVPVDSIRRHAIVIGGSLAGLFAARVLCDHFDRVTVLERDEYPSYPVPRKGVPQGSHAHVLMKRGQLIMEQLFPGLQKQLIADGAQVLDMADDAAWLTPAGWGVRYKSDLEMLTMTRALLDWHVRRRVVQQPKVKVLDQIEVVRLLSNETNDGVAGVLVRTRKQDSIQTSPVPLNADLIVDATGRASAAPRWLKELGYPTPRETVINAFLGYASRCYSSTSDTDLGWKCAYLQAAPPNRTRGAVFFPVEDNRWILSLLGGDRDYPPATEEGFLEFTRNLADPIVYNVIKNLEPQSPISSYRAAENRLRHFEEMSRFPENLLVIGDAACAFNPVYAQGMTIAAMGALTLAETLRVQAKRRGAGNLKGLSRRFQKRLAKVNAAPWLLATGEDCRFRNTVGASPSRMTRFMHSYMDQVVSLTLTDKVVRQVLLEAFHMLRKPTALFQPRILFKVVRMFFRSKLDRRRREGQKHGFVADCRLPIAD